MKPLVQAVYSQVRRQSREDGHNLFETYAWGGQERSHKAYAVFYTWGPGSTIDQPIIQAWNHSLPYMHRHN